jgi:hypothetical protein
MAAQLPVSDFTPGIAPASLDWDATKRELDRFEAKLNSLRPIVKKNGALFALYQLKEIIVQAPTAQMIVDYCEATFPNGMKIQWIIVA